MREHSTANLTSLHLLGDCTATRTTPPAPPHNYPHRIGQCGIAVTDTHPFRILLVQPQANAGFLVPRARPTSPLGEPMPTTKKKKSIRVARKIGCRFRKDRPPRDGLSRIETFAPPYTVLFFCTAAAAFRITSMTTSG
jgi:hypothetical protein